MSGQQWKGRLVQGADPDNPRAYSGVVHIAGFPYRVNIERSWDDKSKVVLIATVCIEDGPKPTTHNTKLNERSA